jgi:hypothetical protein
MTPDPCPLCERTDDHRHVLDLEVNLPASLWPRAGRPSGAAGGPDPFTLPPPDDSGVKGRRSRSTCRRP